MIKRKLVKLSALLIAFASLNLCALEDFDTYASRIESIDPYAFEIDPYSHPALPIESNKRNFQEAFGEYALSKRKTYSTEASTDVATEQTVAKKFTCPYPGCFYSPKYKLQLEEHMRAHTGEQPFSCEYPGCEFKTAYRCALIRHKNTQHENTKSYKCSTCNKIFKRKDILTRHAKNIHKEQ
jgi:hypothetical protein